MRAWITHSDLPVPVRGLVLTVAAAGFLAGLYGRFKGIGTWPLGVDEFYISRSIDHVLQVGLPRFSCGGYYTRGLAYQYLVAGFRLFGLTPELAGRLVAALSSLAVLPAAYRVGKRLEGSLAGWLTVIMLCVSVWEIEMARFARMYAPFQAVFAWYMVLFLRHTVDRDKTALRWMIALSILGVLTWEGGALIGLANLLAILLMHEQGRLKGKDWLQLAGLALLLGLLVASTRDLRGSVELPGQAGGSAVASGRLQLLAAWFAPLRTHPVWTLGLVLPLGLTAASSPWLGTYRRRPLALAGLCAALAAAAVHLFTLTAGVMALLLLAGLVEWRELDGRPARWFMTALVAFLAFWLAAYLWHDGSFRLMRDSAAGAAMPPALQHLFGFPAVYDEFVRPWVRTLPILSMLLALALASQVRSALAAGQGADRAVGNLWSLLLVMLLAVGATPAPRIETRYTFFLYPLLLILATAALLQLMRRQRGLAAAPLALSAMLPLLCFAATEDFQPKHIAAVDSAAVNFRVGMSASRAAHYYPRNDMRTVGQWLAQHVQPGDVVITGVPSLDEYYTAFDYFFLEKGDTRYEAYVCPDGRTERWTNHPVLYSDDALTPILASGRRVFASVYQDSEPGLIDAGRARGWSVRRVWTAPYGNSSVLLIVASSPQAAADGPHAFTNPR